LLGVLAVEAKEFSDMITAALARAKRDRRGFVVMCVVALVIIVAFVAIVLMGQ
jgi:Tfp pilus assembly protein PilX